MNFKTFAKILLLIFIAWSLSPTLSFLFPYPSHTAVKEVLGEKLYDVVGRLVVELSRVTVWSVTLGVILKYLIPFMNFAVPAVERYSTTKLYRRLKAPLSDIGVIALIFIFITITFSSFAPSIEKNVKRQEIREKLKSQTEASLDSLSNAQSSNLEYGEKLFDQGVSTGIFMIDSHLSKIKK